MIEKVNPDHPDNVADEIVEAAREYVFGLGGFEKFAEWGLF